jgi:VanZ family protein
MTDKEKKARASLFTPASWYVARCWLPAFIMVGVSILSGSAGVQTGPIRFTGMDKLGHLVVFGLLAVAWVRALREEVSPKRRWLAAVLLTTGFGLADELHQLTNPDRYFEWGDLLADGLGAMIGASIYLNSRWARQLCERELFSCRGLMSRDN